MKQLVWKEWREHFKLALLAFLAMTLVLGVLVRGDANQLKLSALGLGGSVANDSLQPLISGGIVPFSALFCGIFGLKLVLVE